MSTDINARVAGIRSMYQVAKENDKYHPEILNFLTTFIRKRAPWRPNFISDLIEADTQEALSVIGSIPKSDNRGNPYQIDLQNVDISGAILEGANLERVVLWGSNLRKVRLAGANLKNADLGGVDFTEASLERANLEGAKLWYSAYKEPLRPCIFKGTLLAGTILKGSHLEAANMAEAKDVTNEQLKQAIINNSTILPTYIQKSELRK
jgi:uncharacterized protein YjbI with pentapeptide repeats